MEIYIANDNFFSISDAKVLNMEDRIFLFVRNGHAAFRILNI